MTAKQIESAAKWVILLRHQAKQQHSTEFGSSSLIDLANYLDLLLADNKELDEKCKDYDTLKARLAKLETKAKPRIDVVGKEPSDAVA
jgi:flagellar motility protein MotE (MotC chaperone)